MRVLAVLTVVASAAGLSGLAVILRTPLEAIPVGYRPAEMLPFVILLLAFAGVGVLLVWRRPENVIGRLFCGQAVTIAALLLLAGQFVRVLGAGDAEAAATLAWLSAWLMNGLTVTLAPVLVLFPDGRVTSLAARTSLALMPPAIGLTTLVIALRPGSLASVPVMANPYAWHENGGALDTIFAVGLAAGATAIALAVWSQITRLRRSSGAEHQQLKWFLASMVGVSLSLIPAIALLYGESDATTSSAQRYAGRTIAALASTALPLAIGIAILRYRLYDIDLLINRTLVYGALTVSLAATYFAGVVVLQAALRPLIGGGEVPVALSTLAVVALFQPIRGRIQDFVDRRFYRSRYDATRALDVFGATLRDEVDLDDVRADLIAVVGETLRPAHASLWLRDAKR